MKSYESNQLASNSPIEDSRSEAVSLLTRGLLFGVFDGHGGPACGQVVSKRLMRYLAANLCSRNVLREHFQQNVSSGPLVTYLNNKFEFVNEVKELYEESFDKFINELLQESGERSNVLDGFERSFLRLDQDISTEATSNPNPRTMAVALSGSCAVVAHILGSTLSVGSVGDCVAVLGTLSDTGQWIATKLTNEHNADNIQEVLRIQSEHPANEKETAIRSDRLLGQLAPLRALGDFRFKWSKETLTNFEIPVQSIYLTPPYLSAKPEVMQRALTPKDKFMILASDGLWDIISPIQAVRLLGEYISGKAFLQPLKLPKREIKLGEVEQMLDRRKEGLLKKPSDKNGATYLLRYALGASDLGNIEHHKLAHMLSLPQEIVRLFRDDITITIIYFDSNFLRTNPS